MSAVPPGDLFLSEDEETWWIRRREGLSRWAAAREIAQLEGRAYQEYPTSAYTVRAINGRVGEKDGEPWFWRDPKGTESFYEVTLG